MRIGITCYPTYGGSGIVATELGIELAARGHEIHFITYANPIRLKEIGGRVVYHEVEVTTYPLFDYPPYTLALASRMAEVADTHQLDVLHVHYAIPHAVSGFLAQQMLAPTRHVPVVTTLHGTDVTLVGQDPSYLPITRFSIERSDGVTIISEALKRQTIEVFQTKRDIDVIPNFVDTDIYRPDCCQDLREPFAQEGEILFAHLSNFRPVKRILDCIRVLAMVNETRPARLIMIGDGPDRAPAEALARELGVAERCSFVGKQLEVAPYLSSADLLLLPSQTEGFGLAALEAMACGTPAIASNAGGLPEVITDHLDGRLIDVGNIDAMAHAALEIVASQLDTMSRNARATAENRFSAKRIIPQYEALYQRVLGG